MIHSLPYGRAKTANILFAMAFDKRHRSCGVRAAVVHPRVVQTKLSPHMGADALQKVSLRPADFWITSNPEVNANLT